MNNIEITWNTLIEISAGLIVLFQVGKWLISFGNPFVKLKERVDKHDELLHNDKTRLDRVDKNIQQIDEGLSVLGLAIAEMINHEVSGNDVKKLKEQQEKITTYFYGGRNDK